MKLRIKAIAVPALVVALVGGSSVAASAVTSYPGNSFSCGGSTVPYVMITSTSIGKVNHEANGVIQMSYVFDTTYTHHATKVNPSRSAISSWRAFTTAQGSDIMTASPRCTS